MTSGDPEEPLVESAPPARRLAPGLCRRDPATGESCAWNHGFWQTLRLLGLITTPVHHAAFYREAFAAVRAEGASPRVLVSGAADYAMLAQVLAAFRARGAEPEVTVADICETPLMLSRWYAERLSARIATRCGDVLQFSDPRPYDVVCTHSFLGQFALEARLELIGVWRRLLRPGGLAVTVNRVRPRAGAGRVGFSREQARAFVANVLKAAVPIAGALQVNPFELEREAERYAGRQGAWPMRSLEEIRELFERSGFRVEQLSSAPVIAGPRHAVSGPTTPGGAEYACIMATRL